jgi:hypothetical protein
VRRALSAAAQRPAYDLRGRSIATGLIGPVAIRPCQVDTLVVPAKPRRHWRDEGREEAGCLQRWVGRLESEQCLRGGRLPFEAFGL